MNASRKIWGVAAIVIALSAMVGSPVTAAPISPAPAPMISSGLGATTVHWRGRGGGGAGLAAGLATGLIIGGLLAAPRYYDEPYPYYYGYSPPRYLGPIGYGAPGWEAYCFSRYRSFDPVSGTYLGYDGLRHYCR
jgi:hypothetical protein